MFEKRKYKKIVKVIQEAIGSGIMFNGKKVNVTICEHNHICMHNGNEVPFVVNGTYELSKHLVEIEEIIISPDWAITNAKEYNKFCNNMIKYIREDIEHNKFPEAHLYY